MITLSLALALGGSYLDNIKAANLKAYVTYLASDELEGRGTPSAGLDKAADYIASEFKKDGVKPGNGDSYFQVAPWGKEGKTAKNVIGIIPGSDAQLSREYVIVSAHYDHLGMARLVEDKVVDGKVIEGNSKKDRIYNGADDDASGVAGVIEIGKALAKQKPKRTIVLMTFYGEEKGLVGSQYYVKNPLFPLKDTVANINLEQIGRTDDSEAPRVSAGSLTGFSFSSIGETFGRIGGSMGVPVTGHPQYSAPFFYQSDNAAFAMAGIPAHTICTAFEFPDYHGLADAADKLDYINMEKIVRMTAATVLDVVNAKDRPKWNEAEPKAKRFVDAYKKLMGS